MRWQILSSPGVRWAYDSVENDLYKFDPQTKTGERKEVSIQMLSKFVPFLTVTSAQSKPPDWVIAGNHKPITPRNR